MIPLFQRWFVSFFYDETAFARWTRAGVAMLGELIRNGTIPTGVEGLGSKIGPALTIFAFLIGAGDKTPEVVKQVAEKVEAGETVVVATPPTPAAVEVVTP